MRFVPVITWITLHTGLNYDIHAVAEQKQHSDYDENVARMHEMAEKFDPATEKLFEYLRESHITVFIIFYRGLHTCI
jgi:hypothetical protein